MLTCSLSSKTYSLKLGVKNNSKYSDENKYNAELRDDTTTGPIIK